MKKNSFIFTSYPLGSVKHSSLATPKKRLWEFNQRRDYRDICLYLSKNLNSVSPCSGDAVFHFNVFNNYQSVLLQCKDFLYIITFVFSSAERTLSDQQE